MVVIGHQVLYPRFRVVAARWGNGQTILDTPRVSQRFYEDCPGILLREKCRLIKMNRGWVGNGGTPPSFHLSWKSKEPTDSTWKGDSRADRVKTSSFRSEDVRKRRDLSSSLRFLSHRRLADEHLPRDWRCKIVIELGFRGSSFLTGDAFYFEV